MSKKQASNTESNRPLSVEAKYARRKGERRIARLEAVIANYNQEVRDLTRQYKKEEKQLPENLDTITSTPKRVIEWAKAQKREIANAMQGTRMYSKEGKRYKTKNESYIRKQLDRLTAAVKKVVPNYRAPRDTFASTQQQLNLASSKKTEPSSIYTQVEVSLFYQIHEKLWNKKGVDEHDRNIAILDALNEQRKQDGLAPITLAEAVEATLKSNQAALKMQKLDPSKKMDEFSRKAYEEAAKYDNDDGELKSPTGAATLRLLRAAFATLLKQPDVTKIGTDEE